MAPEAKIFDEWDWVPFSGAGKVLKPTGYLLDTQALDFVTKMKNQEAIEDLEACPSEGTAKLWCFQKWWATGCMAKSAK